MRAIEELICIGDSLTYGYGVKASQKWTQLLAKATGIRVVNHGQCGDTALGMLLRMKSSMPDRETTERIRAGKSNIFLMGGSNDIFYSMSDIPARIGMGTAVHTLLAAGISPVIGITLPVDTENIRSRWRGIADFERASALLEEYRRWLYPFCEAFELKYVDFYSDFVDEYGKVRKELFLDGLHPSAAGHKKMAERLTEELEKG